jgi:hypothetical protein
MKMNQDILTKVKRNMKAILKDSDNRVDVFTMKDKLKCAVPELPDYIDDYVEQARQELKVQRVYEDAPIGRIKVLVME